MKHLSKAEAQLWIEYSDTVDTTEEGVQKQFENWVTAQPAGITAILTSFEHATRLLISVAGRNDLGGIVTRPARRKTTDLLKAA